MASRSSWQSRSEQYHRRQPQGWICYRCKDACGRDVQALPAALQTLRTSALVDLVDRLQFREGNDVRGELPGALELLQGRGIPETRQEVVSFKKCLRPWRVERPTTSQRSSSLPQRDHLCPLQDKRSQRSMRLYEIWRLRIRRLQKP